MHASAAIMTAKQWELWIDRGGTFTDVVAKTLVGDTVTHKLPSENSERYIVVAVHSNKNLMGTDIPPAGSIKAVKMGTPAATNALFERIGEDVFLLITKVFGDLLKAGQQNRPKLLDSKIKRPALL
jgi:5-oxoprolinase (ATP-hydrolysing)